MLPRVSAALSKFLSPITQPVEHKNSEKEQPEKKFQMFSSKKKKKEDSNQEPHLKLVQSPEQKKVALEESPAFVQLFVQFEEQRQSITKGLGPEKYKTAIKTGKKAGRLKKGTMMDDKAD